MLKERIAVLGLNHRSASLALRESVAFSQAKLKDAIRQLTAVEAIDECVLISTCNRVEIYAATQDIRAARERMIRFLETYHNLNIESNLREGLYFYSAAEAIEHLFLVASGLDSMVIGETQILNQVKESYKAASEEGAAGSLLNMLFQRSFKVSKKIRHDTGINRASASVSSAAIDLAANVFGELKDAAVMIIGAGKMGELAARSLISRRARSILVSNRNYEKAKAAASLLGGEAIRFDRIEYSLANTDIVITSTAAPHYVIKENHIRQAMRLRKDRPLLLIDISMPRNIDPRVSRIKNAFLYNMDDLNSLVNVRLKDKMRDLAICQSMAKGEVARFCLSLENYAARTKKDFYALRQA